VSSECLFRLEAGHTELPEQECVLIRHRADFLILGRSDAVAGLVADAQQNRAA
jgi:hypothetical protein